MKKKSDKFQRLASGQIATEYAMLLAMVMLITAMGLFVQVDGQSLFSQLLDAIRQLNYSYIQGMGFAATPI